MIKLWALGALLLCAMPFAVCRAAAPVVVYADAAAIKKSIANDKGHVVLVNFWATWCGPCVAEYPELVTLDKNYRGKGLDVIAVSLDLQEDIGSKVSPFVALRKAKFPQFVLKIDDPEKSIDAFDPTWQGDLPRTFVYSKSGRLVQTLPDQQSYSSFEKAVKRGFAEFR